MITPIILFMLILAFESWTARRCHLLQMISAIIGDEPGIANPHARTGFGVTQARV
jgi:hypothetical protein